jgi:hypothetical protein
MRAEMERKCGQAEQMIAGAIGQGEWCNALAEKLGEENATEVRSRGHEWQGKLFHLYHRTHPNLPACNVLVFDDCQIVSGARHLVRAPGNFSVQKLCTRP